MLTNINPVKLIKFVLKYIWLPILCAAIGFGALYYRAEKYSTETYTASATVYVFSGNPNIINYQYTSSSDFYTAEKIIDTYAVVVKSSKVMDAVSERLTDYNLTAQQIAATITLSAVDETSVMRVSCTTDNAQKSMDICNTVVDIAPTEIIRVINAGSVEVIDYAELPKAPNPRNSKARGVTGAMAGAVGACALLFVIFLFKGKIEDSNDLKNVYEQPVLSCIPNEDEKKSPGIHLINEDTSSQILNGYAKLRMNLSFAMHDKAKVVFVSSSIPGEGKSTVSGNLAIAAAMDGKHVLLIDADMRKPVQAKLFGLSKTAGGLSDMLVPESEKEFEIHEDVREHLDVLTAGTLPPNPSELLGSPEMRSFIEQYEKKYDLIIIDMPPINIVPDALVLSGMNAGMLFVVRCGYSTHSEIKKALEACAYTKMDVLGFVMTCSRSAADGYYSSSRYSKYSYYYRRYYGGYEGYNKKMHGKRGRSSKSGKHGKAGTK